MKILKHGKYKRKTVVTCHHCECEFEVEYGECTGTHPDYVFIDCPECGNSIIVDENDFQTELSND